jgi:hypothetical protein|tara:strand:- start:362 stop:556 length:195 start_codon:yes stop_codon:yes gene_type:complete
MTDQQTMERIQQEVVSSNKAKAHAMKDVSSTPEWSLAELKVSHHNHTLDNEVANIIKEVRKLDG